MEQTYHPIQKLKGLAIKHTLEQDTTEQCVFKLRSRFMKQFQCTLEEVVLVQLYPESFGTDGHFISFVGTQTHITSHPDLIQLTIPASDYWTYTHDQSELEIDLAYINIYESLSNTTRLSKSNFDFEHITEIPNTFTIFVPKYDTIVPIPAVFVSTRSNH